MSYPRKPETVVGCNWVLGVVTSKRPMIRIVGHHRRCLGPSEALEGGAGAVSAATAAPSAAESRVLWHLAAAT